MAHFLVPFLEDPMRPLVWDCDPWTSRSSAAATLNDLARLGHYFDNAIRHGIRDEAVRRKDVFAVDLDVHGYDPQDLNISVKDNMLTIEGKHEDNAEDGSSFSSRHFVRSFSIPKNVQVEQFKSRLAKDGRTLRIEAPLVKPAIEEKKEEPKEVEIAIKHVKGEK